MNLQKLEDVKDVALKLNKIRSRCPEDYFYIKGWIHCLLQKENEGGKQFRKSPKINCVVTNNRIGSKGFFGCLGLKDSEDLLSKE